MSSTRRISVVATMLALALVANACGGDGATTTSVTDTTGATTTTAATTTPDATTTTAATATTEAEGDMVIRFRSGDYPFSIAYPPSWDSNTDEEGIVIILTAPDAGVDPFFENINVIVTDEAQGFETLEDYVDATYATLEAVIPEFSFINEVDYELGDEPAHAFVYQGAFEGIVLTFLQVYAFYEDQAYIFTYTANSDGDYDALLEEVTTILRSWQFH